MLTTIRLYGKLGYKFGRTFRMAVNSPAEAMRALCSQVKGFERFLLDSKTKYGIGYGVFVGKRNITEDELQNPSGGDDIRIAPFVQGAKSGWVNIILGAVLVVAGLLVSAIPGMQVLGSAMVKMGMGFILGGVSMLLSPMPKTNGPNDKEDNRASTQFSGPVNTQAQGNVVPLVYGGPIIVGSAVISASIEARDNVYIPTNAENPATGGGGGGSVWWNVINQAS